MKLILSEDDGFYDLSTYHVGYLNHKTNSVSYVVSPKMEVNRECTPASSTRHMLQNAYFIRHSFSLEKEL